MLENPQERVELLKAGLSGKKIEELYLLMNDFRIIGNSPYIEPPYQIGRDSRFLGN